MKIQLESNTNPSSKSNFATACLATCQKVLAQFENSRQAIVAEFNAKFGAPEQLLRLAVNEAEALAWQTEYPHLFFPALAVEKAQTAVSWHERQRAF